MFSGMLITMGRGLCAKFAETMPVRNSIQKLGHLSIAVLLSSAVSMGQTASVKLTGMGTGTMDGASVGPYTATINGASTLVICDDYVNNAYTGQTWNANVSGPANLSGASLAQYEEAAYLSSELLGADSANNLTEEGELSFAIWGVFDPAAITSLLVSNVSEGLAAESYLAGALGKSNANFQLYTPTGRIGTQFIVMKQQVATPEPSALLLLGFDLFCVFAVIFLLRRYTVGRLPL
jgi:hypothetical protein